MPKDSMTAAASVRPSDFFMTPIMPRSATPANTTFVVSHRPNMMTAPCMKTADSEQSCNTRSLPAEPERHADPRIATPFGLAGGTKVQ